MKLVRMGGVELTGERVFEYGKDFPQEWCLGVCDF